MKGKALLLSCIIILASSCALLADRGWNVEMIGSVPGTVHDVYMLGNYAYLCAGYTLVILDIANPLTPLEIGRIDMPDIALRVHVVGDFAYVAHGEEGLRVIDVSDPNRPREVAFHDTPGTAQEVHAVGSFAYVADGEEGLRVIDVSDPSRPWEVTFFPGKADEVYVAGGHAYVVNNDLGAGLSVIDISVPANPHRVGSLSCHGRRGMHGIYVSGKYAYLTGAQVGFDVLDVSDPSAPLFVGGCSSPISLSEVYVIGNYAYVSYTDPTPDPLRVRNGFQVIDVSDPMAPQAVGMYQAPGIARGIHVNGSHAYLANGGAGLRVIDISDPASPQEVGAYDACGSPVEVHVTGGYAYVVNPASGLQVIDVSNPSKPNKVGDYSIQVMPRGSGFHVSDGYAYMADPEFGLQVIDVSDPSKPNKVGDYNVTMARGLYFSDGYVYIGTRGARGGTLVIDVSDPKNPQEVGLCRSAQPYGTHVVGDYAYMAVSALTVFDVSNPSAPQEVARFSFGSRRSEWELHVADGYAYAAAGDLHVIDVSDPKNPHKVGVCELPDDVRNVYAADGYAYVTGGDLHVIDVSDPEQPHEVGFYNTPGNAMGVDVVDGYIYVADMDGGLCILKYTGASPADVTPPVLTTAPSVPNIAASSAVIEWGTDEPGSSVVEYGATPKYGLTAESADKVIEHSVLLTSLSPNTTYYYRISSTDPSGNTVWSQQGTFNTLAGSQEAIEPKNKLVIPWGGIREYGFALGQNYPNPFNPETWIPYQLAEDMYVVIRIYDSKGRSVRRLDLGFLPAGCYLEKDKAAYWDGRNSWGEKTVSGVYFYRLEAGDFTAVRKMVIAR